jgi:hypothetical protein
LSPTKLHNLWPTPDSEPTAQEWSYVTPQPRYGGTFLVRPAAPPTGFRQVTVAEFRDGRFVFTTHAEVPILAGGPRALAVRVRNWEGTVLRLQARQVARLLTAEEVRRLPNQEGFLLQPTAGAARTLDAERRYVLELDAGVRGNYRFTLTASVPGWSAAELSPPDIQVAPLNQESAHPRRWIVLAGNEPVADDVAGLAAADANHVLQSWPEELNRLRPLRLSAWEVTATDWRLRLRPRSGTAGAGPIHVFLAEHTAAVTDGRRWLHQARYWLSHESAATLPFNLPVGARVLMATLDGRAVPLLQQGPHQLWLPLSGAAGARALRLTWTSESAQEPIDRPRLELPQIDGAAAGPVLWTIHAPPEYRLEAIESTSGQSAKPASAAGRDLRRAAALLDLYGTVADRANTGQTEEIRPQLVAVRDHFERFCKYAKKRLALSTEVIRDQGPDGQPLVVWREELLRRYEQLPPPAPPGQSAGNQAPEQPPPAGVFPDAASAAEQEGELPLAERGRPAYFHGQVDCIPPVVQLTSETSIRLRDAWVLSAATIGLVLAFGAGSWLFGKAFWPEQLAVLGGIGLLGFGPELGWLFVLLPAVWIFARLVQGGRRLLAWSQPAEAAQGSSAHSR